MVQNDFELEKEISVYSEKTLKINRDTFEEGGVIENSNDC